MSHCIELDFIGDGRDPRKVLDARAAKRWLGYREIKGRGCEFCLHMVRVGYLYLTEVACPMPKKSELKPNSQMRFCRHKSCPYRELDGLTDYLKEYDAKIMKGEPTIGSLLKNLGLVEPRRPKPCAAPTTPSETISQIANT